MYEKRFQAWIDDGITADEIEGMYSSAMEAIRADPSRKAKAAYTVDKSFRKPGKSTLEERVARIAAKKSAQVSLPIYCPSLFV